METIKFLLFKDNEFLRKYFLQFLCYVLRKYSEQRLPILKIKMRFYIQPLKHRNW